MDILSVDHIYKHYPKFDLKDVSFSLEAGKIMGFIGRNGAGKTTTIKGIMNIIHLDSGNVFVSGKNMIENEGEVKESVAVVLNGIDFFPQQKIKNIAMVYSKFYSNWNEELFEKYLAHFELDENKKIMQLSQGMKVKFLLSLALSHDAKLLILDEPTSGLDPISREEILDIFLEIVKKKDRAILFSTHITSDLDKVANNITYIRNGEIIISEEKGKLISTYKIASGNLEDFKNNKNEFIAFKEYMDCAKGLILSTNEEKISKLGFKIEEPTLDEIMLFLEMEDEEYEEFTL